MRKYFIITIDTEGDNLWGWDGKEPIKTENVLFLKRFQELCNNFGFKPVWLTNYEMISDSRYVDFVSKVVESKTGEIGMHLHAWNSPPFYTLLSRNDGKHGKPYLIEYPEEIMYEKIHYLTDIIVERTGVKPVSHRAGRWATNHTYFEILMEEGYRIDCSVTPHIDWTKMPGYTSGARGTDYSKNISKEYYIYSNHSKRKLLEVPITTCRTHSFIMPERKSLKGVLGSAYRAVKGQVVWLRPTRNNIKRMLWLTNKQTISNSSYLMFMLHSSELMPGGNPVFRNLAEIELLYKDLEVLFSFVARTYTGITLSDYEKLIVKRKLTM